MNMQSPKALVADDEGLVSMMIEDILLSRGYEVTVVNTRDQLAAEHVRLRFDIWPIDIEDHVRLQHSRLTAVGYSTATFSEVIFVLPNGEIEPDPHSPEMAKAWARYAATRQPSG